MRPAPDSYIRQRLQKARKAKAETEEQRRIREFLLQRIDLIGRAARDNWYGLLFYMTFVGITLLGIRDVDFFSRERETDLPVLQVAIPTMTLFTFAPLLGAALFVNLHLQLVKFWEALSKANEGTASDPLSDHIAPRLISDFALILRQYWRTDGSLRSQPMGWLLFGFTAFLLFLPAPFVLAGFWWRSMPAHDAVLTIGFCGLPMVISLYTAWVSARHLWRVMRHPGTIYTGPKNPMSISRGAAAYLVAATIIVSGFGWMRTEGSMAQLMSLVGQNSTIRTYLAEAAPYFPVRANLSSAILVETPPGWQDHARARQTFRSQWCRVEGLPPEICGPAPSDAEQTPAFLASQRLQWCRKTFDPDIPDLTLAQDCDTHFSTADERFDRDWNDHRKTDLAALTPRPLSGAQLDGANLIGAQMDGADLREAQMKGADLSNAQMEGANLSFAQMEGAILSSAQMERVDLSFAQMERAKLSNAQMEGANLSYAQIEEADLSFAQMERADLSSAQMEGADFRNALIEAADLSEAQLEGADLSGAQMEGANLSNAQMEGAKLRGTQMEGANLSGAKMKGADLSRAQMEGAHISGTELDASTSLFGAFFRAASARDMDFSDVILSSDQINSMFGDASVGLRGVKGPNDPAWPAHWPRKRLSSEEFEAQWRAWQASIGYIPRD